MNQIFHIIYIQPLKTIIVLTVLILIVWAVIGAVSENHKELWHRMNGILAVLSIAIILYTTIIKREAKGPQIIPFIRTLEQIRQQPELIREMVMNAFLFFPVGLTLPYSFELFPDKSRKKKGNVLITIIFALFLSCFSELIQYLCHLGNAELSDIIMNTMGTAVGSVAYVLSPKINNLLQYFKNKRNPQD